VRFECNCLFATLTFLGHAIFRSQGLTVKEAPFES
jgi:hypothetical protein